MIKFYQAMKKEFRDFFSLEEFSLLVETSSVMDDSTIVIWTTTHYIEIASGYNPQNKSEICIFFDDIKTDKREFINKTTLFEILKIQKIIQAQYLEIKE